MLALLRPEPCALQPYVQVTIQRQYIRVTRKTLGQLRNLLRRRTPRYLGKEEK